MKVKLSSYTVSSFQMPIDNLLPSFIHWSKKSITKTKHILFTYFEKCVSTINFFNGEASKTIFGVHWNWKQFFKRGKPGNSKKNFSKI